MFTLHRVILYLLIFSFVYLFIFSFSAFSSVVLNEVAIQPNQIVELYNTSSTSADISFWYIDDSGGSTYYTVPLQTIIPPKSCLLFNSDFNLNKSSADSIRLFDSSAYPTSLSAKLIEQYSYSKAPENNYSFYKKTDGGTEWATDTASLGLSNETLLSCIATPTPSSIPTHIPTTAPVDSPYPTTPPSPSDSPTPQIGLENIYISEIYPYPQSGEHEWVEFYNANDSSISLENWYIDDGENEGSTPKLFSLVIDPRMYMSVEFSSSIFNNEGDKVRLLDNLKNEKESLEYGKITKGKSMGRITFTEDSFCEQQPSKNSENAPCLMHVTPVSSRPQATPTKSASKILSNAQPKKNPTALLQKTYSLPAQKKQYEVAIDGSILGEMTAAQDYTSPIPYLTFVSGSYSLLTIVSLFIKMRDA